MTAIREAGRITTVPLDRPIGSHLLGLRAGAAQPHLAHAARGPAGTAGSSISTTSAGPGLVVAAPGRVAPRARRVSWGTHHLPHDADLGSSARKRHDEATHPGRGRHEKQVRGATSRYQSTGIDLMRAALPVDNWFDRVECAGASSALTATSTSGMRSGASGAERPCRTGPATAPMHGCSTRGTFRAQAMSPGQQRVSSHARGPGAELGKSTMQLSPILTPDGLPMWSAGGKHAWKTYEHRGYVVSLGGWATTEPRASAW